MCVYIGVALTVTALNTTVHLDNVGMCNDGGGRPGGVGNRHVVKFVDSIVGQHLLEI